MLWDVSQFPLTANVIMPWLIAEGFTPTGSIEKISAISRSASWDVSIVLASDTKRSVAPSVLEGTIETIMIAPGAFVVSGSFMVKVKVWLDVALEELAV